MRKFFILAALALVGNIVQAQNIKQNVEVSNDYRSNFADFQKQSTKINLADSLYKFNYHFDYSVFDSPYKGSYEFEPYQIALQFDPTTYPKSDFFLRLGAGLMPHPELDLYWSPIQSDNYGLSLSNQGKGRIAYFAPSQSLAGANGYDLSDSFKIHSRTLLKNGRFDFVAAYDGIFTSTALNSSGYNSGYAQLAYLSKSFLHLFACEANLTLRYYLDNQAQIQARTSGSNTRLNGRLKPIVKNTIGYIVDFDFQMDNLIDNRAELNNQIRNYAEVTPSVVFQWNNLDFSLGAKFEYGYKFGLIPMINFNWDISALRLRLYAGTQGGQSLNNYHKLKTVNHFYTLSPSYIGQTPDFSSDLIDAFMGISGTIGHFFHYKLKFAYRRAESMLLDAMPSESFAALSFADIRNKCASFDAKWNSPRVNIDAHLDYNSTDVLSYQGAAFTPALVYASFSGSYNWLKRVYAGLSADYSSSRTSLNPIYSDLPWWCDLGLFAEYKVSKSFGTYLRIGNILAMPIERQPGFIEKDPYFTIGINLYGK